MEKLEIEINPDDDIIESFDLDQKNILQVQIQLPTGEVVEDSRYRVILALSKEAMIGMSTNLLRAAYDETYDLDPQKVRFWELFPSDKELLSLSTLGIYLHPKSCQFLLGESNFGSIHEILEQEEKG